MTISNIQYSYLALQVTGTAKTTQPRSVPDNTSITDIFGSAVSCNLSGAALDMMGLGSGGDSSDAIDGLLNNYSSYLGGTNKSESKKDNSDSTDALFALFGSGSVSAISSVKDILGISSNMSDDDFIHGAGPLPAFLTELKAQLGLSATQSQALDNIALQFKDADKSPETVSAIAAALTQAGITA